MAEAHLASRVEDRLFRGSSALLRRRNWSRRVLPYVGYGSVDPELEGRDPHVRVEPPKTSTWHGAGGAPTSVQRRIPQGGHAHVLGRVVLARSGHPSIPVAAPNAPVRRGGSLFFEIPQPDVDVIVTLGDATSRGKTDRGGYFDIEVSGHNLTHGWHEARIECGGIEAVAQMQIIGGKVSFGIISDIDDTVLNTVLPRPLIAAWNTFVVRETVRREVPGMASFYRAVIAEKQAAPGEAPMFYLSTGAWNTQPVLTRFLRRYGYPTGTLLLTDWGPTETSWFRSGPQHKRRWLRRLAREFPHIRWLLVGDDGQHDPVLYEEFALSFPEHVAGIAIRQLTPAQQVLSHGYPLHMVGNANTRVPGVSWVEGQNGFVLHGRLKKAWSDARAT